MNVGRNYHTGAVYLSSRFAKKNTEGLPLVTQSDPGRDAAGEEDSGAKTC